MGRAPCCDKANVKRGPWSPEEDAKLKGFIEKYGTGGNWIALPQKAGLKRCGKSCRLRWLNYLRPNIRHGEFTDDEDRIICNFYASIGSRWSVIAAQLPGRTDNDIKNYWNTKLKKKRLNMSPSLLERTSTFSYVTSQPPPYEYHHTSHQIINNTSSFYNLTPNYMNVANTSNAFFVHDDYNNITDFQPVPPPLPANNLISNNNVNVNDDCLSYLSFQDDHHSMRATSSVLMFGSTFSSSEDGNCMSKIKQEDCQITLDHQLLGDEVQNQSFMIKNHVTPLRSSLEELKQFNFTNYLLHDADENKTSQYQKGTWSYDY